MASVAPALTERISAELDAALAAAGAPQQAEAARRRDALRAALVAGLPGNRDDNFRYSQLRPLEKLKFAPLPLAPDAAARAAPLLPAALLGFTRIVYVDGQLCASLSGTTPHTTRTIEASTAPAPAGRRFALINAAFATETLHISTPVGADASRIELLFVALGEGSTGASYPRVHVEVAAGARLELVERHIGASEGATFSNANVDVQLADSAHCSHYRLQSLGTRAMHIETLHATLGAVAQYELHGLHAGAAAARSTMYVELAGARSGVTVHAGQVAGGTQVQDTQLTIEHRGAGTTTQETFRGIGSGRARIAFNGHMIVRETARGANTQQSLRCLLAGTETEADLRPQLEIYTDDVRASHGATTGKLDENMLFYLLSRGIDRDTAQNLLKWAFIAEVVTRIDIPRLRQDAQQLVLGRVQGLIGEALS